MIKFNIHNVTDTDTKIKARVHYSLDNRSDCKKVVTLYSKDYNKNLQQIFTDEYRNDTDTMTDYFEKGKVSLFEDHPLYTTARKKVEGIEAKQKGKKK